MTEQLDRARPTPALKRLRAATAEIHQRLEDRVDAVARLADPGTRPELVRRYAALHIPADAALAGELAGIEGLDFAGRSRAALLHRLSAPHPLPAFPRPLSRAEALGMLYVLEGSTLGGRLILRALAARGVVDGGLGFLDPYGSDTGNRWRSFLSILDREIGDNPIRLEELARGGVRGFYHAETILCGTDK